MTCTRPHKHFDINAVMEAMCERPYFARRAGRMTCTKPHKHFDINDVMVVLCERALPGQAGRSNDLHKASGLDHDKPQGALAEGQCGLGTCSDADTGPERGHSPKQTSTRPHKHFDINDVMVVLCERAYLVRWAGRMTCTRPAALTMTNPRAHWPKVSVAWGHAQTSLWALKGATHRGKPAQGQVVLVVDYCCFGCLKPRARMPLKTLNCERSE